jgi:hypothetical protein
MNKRALFALLATLFLTALAFAQEGHPLVGSWHGEFTPASGPKSRIVMALKWDTKNITGTLNPGPRSGPIKATLDAEKWMVHFEADAKDMAGKPMHVVGDGKMDNIGSYNRTITGTWMQGDSKGDFKITRD